MITEKLLSPSREAALQRELRRASQHARQRGERVLCIHREELDDMPSLLDVFERAESRGAHRFFAARPARGLEVVAVGCARRVVCTSADPWTELRRESERYADSGASAAAWFGGVAFDVDAGRALSTPLAIDTRDGRADQTDLVAEPKLELEMRAAHWQPFGSASFVLPELAIVRRARSTSLVIATWVDADTSAEGVLTQIGAWLAKPEPAAAPYTKMRLVADEAALARYREAAARVLAEIHAGRAEKVVLACEERHRLPSSWRASRALRTTLETHPDALSFAQGVGESTFFGATPELLVRREGLHVESAAVAATARRDVSRAAEARLALALRSSIKEQREHGLVVAEIRRALEPFCATLEIADAPVVLRTGALQHLHTPIAGRLAAPLHVLDIAARLHPTPALGGYPRAAALELIRAREGFDRGWYGGPIGWFDSHGDGELYVALRCALAEPRALHLFAGSGLVADSDPERETAETALKLRSIREALDPA